VENGGASDLPEFGIFARVPPIRLPIVPLTGGGVRLRSWEAKDVGLRISAGSDQEILRFTSVPESPSEAEAIAWIEQREQSLERGEAAYFAVVLPPVDAAIGSAGLIRLDWEHSRAEVGYWITARERGRHIATRALSLLCTWALRDLGLARLELFTNTDNMASQRVALNCGFLYEGFLRSYRRGRRAREDNLLFSRLPTDPWPPHRGRAIYPGDVMVDRRQT
jgi:ribosomal-protein-alanine N-acetyltransferase